MEWNLAEAKNKFSELVNRALSEGPQKVRRRKDVVMVIDIHEYERLKGMHGTFKDYLLTGESFVGLDLKRDTSLERDIKL